MCKRRDVGPRMGFKKESIVKVDYKTSLLYIRFRVIGLMSRVFANGLGDRGSIPGSKDSKNGT